MNDFILIHYDNTPLITDFQNSIKFNPSIEELNNSDIDMFISNQIIPQLVNKEFKIIFIRDTLSENYIDFYGLTLAYHIRLSLNILTGKSLLPIVILSDINEFIINKLSTVGEILFTKNIFLVKNCFESIDYIKTLNLQILTEIEYEKKFLDLINVEPPADYLSHHSIANEWSIYRWAEFLKVDSESIQRNKEKISSMLYFKYLISKYPIPKKSGISFTPKIPKNEGLVLYIDDEWNKGWSDVLEKYFNLAKNIKFKTFEYEYKDKNKFRILKDIKEEILAILPDIIILDLRITQKDHEDIDIESITGIKLINSIKSINKGIQIIMLTASNKSTILEKLYQYGILGYIKKEHPQDIHLTTKDNLIKLKTFIDNGLEKKYLKDIWTLQQDILNLKIFENDKYNVIKLEVLSVFEILNTEMNNKFNYSMFAVFKILESLVNFYIEEKTENKKRYAYWINTNDKIPCVNDNNFIVETKMGDSNDSTENKIRVLLHKKFNLKDNSIHTLIKNIVYKRNKTIHAPKNSRDKVTVEKEDILSWFKMIKDILNSIDITTISKV